MDSGPLLLSPYYHQTKIKKEGEGGEGGETERERERERERKTEGDSIWIAGHFYCLLIITKQRSRKREREG